MSWGDDLAYARSAFKWKLMATSSGLVRALEPASERAPLPAVERIGQIDEVMREASYTGQSWGEVDSFPSVTRVAWRYAQPGKKIGDCQSFAELAAAMLEELPPEEGIERVELACARLALPKRRGGHAVCLYKRQGKWGVMQQGGRLGAFNSREEAMEALARSFKGRLLWWCRLEWPTLACLEITRCQN